MNDTKKLKYSDLIEKVETGELKESDISQYFEESVSGSNNLSPHYNLNTDKVELDERGLGQVGLNLANYLCKRARQREYAKRTWDAHHAGKKITRVMAEGDSWFQYPFKLDDVIDHLNKREDIAIQCYSDGGDILTNMLAKEEFINGLADQLPHYFLISGGGNDLVDGPGLKRFVKPYADGLSAEDYLRPEYKTFSDMIYYNYRRLFARVIQVSQRTQILCHGYSLPIPNNGKWLGKPMSKLGITDQSLQRKIIAIILNDVNDKIASAASIYGDAVKFIDVRGTIPDDGWHDEFHPSSENFSYVANEFSAHIKSR